MPKRKEAPGPGASPREERTSPWSTLGLESTASLLDVKRAFRKRALETHPDRGGEAEQFRKVQSAYEKLVKKLGGAREARRKR